MSLWIKDVPWLTLRPRIVETEHAITVSTGLLTRLLTLFLRIKKVSISPFSQKVIFSTRTGYLFTSSYTLTFDNLWHIDYSFDALATEWGLNQLFLFGKQDQVESFTVSLVTKENQMHPVCSFRGEGTSCTGWTGILLGDDDVIDLRGTQENESRKFARYLSSVLNVPIGKPIKDLADMATCAACGQTTSPKSPRCLYCGHIHPIVKESKE